MAGCEKVVQSLLVRPIALAGSMGILPDVQPYWLCLLLAMYGFLWDSNF